MLSKHFAVILSVPVLNYSLDFCLFLSLSLTHSRVPLQAEFTAMRDQYMRAGEGFIISYSITDRRSLQEARQFKQLIDRVRRTANTPVVLVGNKSDLTHLRQVRIQGKEGWGKGRPLVVLALQYVLPAIWLH